MPKKWIFPEKTADRSVIDELCRAFDIPALVARVLAARGCADARAAEGFIRKESIALHPPLLLADMDKAVARVREALENGEKITIYGDYDVDGITSTALMVRALGAMGAEADAYIPDRRGEGYGVNCAALEKIAANGTSLVITVDTGGVQPRRDRKADD